MKTCNICNTEKPIDEFYTNGKTPKGTIKYKAACKPCSSAQIQAKRADLLETILQELNWPLECNMCGYNKNSAALCFHHLDEDEKDFSIAGHSKTSKLELKEEIEKCVILCHNCHMELHYPHKQMST